MTSCRTMCTGQGNGSRSDQTLRCLVERLESITMNTGSCINAQSIYLSWRRYQAKFPISDGV